MFASALDTSIGYRRCSQAGASLIRSTLTPSKAPKVASAVVTELATTLEGVFAVKVAVESAVKSSVATLLSGSPQRCRALDKGDTLISKLPG